MNRRDFVMGSLVAGPLLSLPKWAKSSSFGFTDINDALDMAPLEKLSAFGGSRTIEGDLQDEAHEIFWDKPGYLKKKGGMPVASQHYDVVIVGGGISGLSAAYHLNGKKILLLEGNPRMGGNSKSQNYQRSYVSQGAAYIANFDQGDDIDQLLSSLGVKKFIRKTTEADEGVHLNGKLFKNFWQGTTDPKNAQEFIRAREKFQDIFDNKYPELPIWDSSSSGRSYLNSLDSMTFSEWIKREIGTSHPHILEYITLYCWSSFSATPEELSAAQGLNFLASDLSGTQVLPGGNGFIAQAIFEKLRSRGITMLADTFAVDIRSLGGKAQICFRNSQRTLETVTATKCIVASPKFVMKHIIDGLPASQSKAMSAITYRAYLVANIFLKKKLPSQGYDLFSLLGQNPTNAYEDSKKRTFSDIIFSDWSVKDAVDKTILTLYIPMPFPMGNQYLFTDNLYSKYESRIQERLNGIINWSDVEGMRLVRTGHSVPVATKGFIVDGTFERASASIDGCIHFANQDNWGNPCFETSYGSALRVTQRL